jgi:hypothetical protein
MSGTPTTPRQQRLSAANGTLSNARRVIMRIGHQDEQSPLGRFGKWRKQ